MLIIQPFHVITIFTTAIKFVVTLKEPIRKKPQQQKALHNFKSIGLQIACRGVGGKKKGYIT